MKRCTSIKADGAKCGAPAQKDKATCVFHNPDPAIQAAQLAAKVKGGQHTQAGVDDGPKAILRICRRTIKKVLLGRLEAKQGTAVAALCSVALKALSQLETDKKVGELDERLANFEQLTTEQLLRLAEGGSGEQAGSN